MNTGAQKSVLHTSNPIITTPTEGERVMIKTRAGQFYDYVKYKELQRVAYNRSEG